MKKIDFRIRKNPVRSVGGFLPIADFAVDVTDEFRFCGLELVEAPDGQHIISIPRAKGWPAASIAPATRKFLKSIALELFYEKQHTA